MEATVSNYPVTAVMDTSRNGEWWGSNAVLHTLNNKSVYDASVANLQTIASNAKDHAREIGEVKQTIAILAKDNAIALERLERENQQRLGEILSTVRAGDKATQDLIMKQECDRLAAENAELKFRLRQRPDPVPVPV